MVAFVKLLPLAGFVLPIIAVKIGRHDVPLPSQTLQVRDEIGGWSIAPTPPPSLRFEAMAVKRQEGGPTCGYYEYNSEAFDCFTDQACVTKGSYFGCTAGSQPYTACLDGFNSICSQSTEGFGTLCCNFNTDFPLCVTALKPLTSYSVATITGYRCGNNRAKGEKLILETLGTSTTSTLSASTPGSSTVNNIPAETSTNSSDSSSGGTPVGPIVGGVIGGLAVLGLSVFAIVWLWLRNRRQKSHAAAAATSSSMMNQSYNYSPMSPTGAPTEPHSPPPPSTHDANAYKGFYHQSAVTSPNQESYYQSAHPVSNPRSTPDGMYQNIGPSHSPATEDPHRLSEVAATNPAGTGNNATELPSERYSRY
ncbi:hypothetical protein EsH8_V_000308 [Colletotrichum jinshuiense]